MSPRHAFHPGLGDPLEARLVLSSHHPLAASLTHLSAAGHSARPAAHAAATPKVHAARKPQVALHPQAVHPARRTPDPRPTSPGAGTPAPSLTAGDDAAPAVETKPVQFANCIDMNPDLLDINGPCSPG
jgi:hypothetical protein